MASTFVSGIAFAAPIMGLAALFAVHEARAENSTSASLNVAVTGIKSASGVVRLVICPPDTGFPNCQTRAERSASLKIANGRATAQFSGLPAGTYAVGVFHDANSNGKLDTALGIPREGYGFSRNPPFMPRAPKFGEALIRIDAGAEATISLRYIFG